MAVATFVGLLAHEPARAAFASSNGPCTCAFVAFREPKQEKLEDEWPKSIFAKERV